MGISAFAYAPRRMHDSQYGAPCSGVEPPLVLIQRSLLISFLFCILLVTCVVKTFAKNEVGGDISYLFEN